MRADLSLFASASVVALLIAAPVAAVETPEMGPMAPETSDPVEMASVAPDTATKAPVETDSNSFLLETEEGGSFVIEVPAGEPVEIFIDGQLVLVVPEVPEGAEPGDPIQAIIALGAGQHIVTVKGAGFVGAALDRIRLGRAGAELRPFNEAVSGPAPNLAALPGTTPAGAPGLPARPPGIGQGGGVTPFTIGGGSSQAARGGGGSGSGNGPVGGPNNISGPGGGGLGGGMAGGFGGGASGGASGGGTSAGGSVPIASAAGTGGSASNGGTGSGGGISVPSFGGGGGGSSAGGGSAPSTPNPSAPPAPNTPPPPATPAPPPPPAPVIPAGTVVPANTPAAPVGPGQSVSSPLAPPVVEAPAQAIQLTAGATGENVISSNGQTLFGIVQDPQAFDIVNVTIQPSGRTTTVDVGLTTGQFAVRVFPEDMGPTTSVTLTAANSSNSQVQTQAVNYNFTNAVPQDGLSQALNRVSYGATPSLYARVRAIGFANYINEQLSPETINDAAFNGSNLTTSLLPGNNQGNSNDVRDGTMEYELANAVYSELQLREVMGAFWVNHFHANNKNSNIVRNFMTDREFFRQNAFGRFEDLLLYSARSPLMSQYLDNDESRVNRINENYGREILELHTVGVDGGYGDDDVIAVSRIFTGWRYERTDNFGDVDRARHVYEFQFEPDRHDAGDKDIPFLSTTIAGRSGATGVQEGEELISILASDPRTQRFVCGKIVQKFVADNPPANLVQACVNAWASNDGSSREILRAVLTHPDFVTSVQNTRSLARTPFEFTAAYMRAVGASPVADGESDFFRRFRESVTDSGWAPWYFPAPTGLPEVSAAWLASASLVARYNKLSEVAERAERYGIDLQADITEAGLETAEEVAAFLLGVATADRYRRDEFYTMVSVLRGDDGIFEPMSRDEKPALDRAAGLLLTLPSFHLQ